MRKDGLVAALDLLEQAIAIDRHYGPALPGGELPSALVTDGWAEDAEGLPAKGIDLARRALQVRGRTTRASSPTPPIVLAYFGEDIGP